MFAALGIGAIAGALLLGRVRRVLSTNATLAAAGLLMAASLLSLVVIPSYPAALVILVAAGLSWTSTISTLVAELQLFLPRWVMARGMAIWTMIFTGCQAGGALIWGLLANRVATFATAWVLALVAGGLGLVSRVPDASADDIDPVSYGAKPGSAYRPTRQLGRWRSPSPTPSPPIRPPTGSPRCSSSADPGLGFSDPPATAVDLLPPTTDADR
jgi:MFS family permease